MSNIRNLGLAAVLKNCIRVSRHPRIAARVVTFEAEKHGLVWPGRSKDIDEFRGHEVPVSRYRFLMEDLVQNGHHRVVVLLGGEPTLCPGFEE